MVLVDTSVWVDHLRNGNHDLQDRLLNDQVACHPLVIGELACGNLQRRDELLSLLRALPVVDRVSDEEILFFIERHRLYGQGLGLVDMHLLASCAISHTALWTLDNRLYRTAQKLGRLPDG